MQNWLKENWFKVLLLAFLIVFVVGGFYWYELRPTLIKRECSQVVAEKLSKLDEKHSVLDWQRLYNLSSLESDI